MHLSGTVQESTPPRIAERKARYGGGVSLGPAAVTLAGGSAVLREIRESMNGILQAEGEEAAPDTVRVSGRG